MRSSTALERLLVAALLCAAIAITVAIVVVGLRARRAQPVVRTLNPSIAEPPAAANRTSIPGLHPQSGTTKFWVDFLAFGDTSLPVGAKHVVPTIVAGVPLRLSGWAVDQNAKNLAAAVFAQIDNNAAVPMNYHIPRADVAKFFHEPAYTLAGFNGALPTDHLSSGVHSIFLDVINSAGTAYYHVDTKQRIVIKSARHE
ncbi:MAG: hypothetical protein JOZ97_03155 [Candidatus Eremiobacteraeota bacterium]|nr:hypothetical protein [Candidatus Eremiobacteraeota bacterium]